jgi:hypothetical protein
MNILGTAAIVGGRFVAAHETSRENKRHCKKPEKIRKKPRFYPKEILAPPYKCVPGTFLRVAFRNVYHVYLKFSHLQAKIYR